MPNPTSEPVPFNWSTFRTETDRPIWTPRYTRTPPSPTVIEVNPIPEDHDQEGRYDYSTGATVGCRCTYCKYARKQKRIEKKQRFKAGQKVKIPNSKGVGNKSNPFHQV